MKTKKDTKAGKKVNCTLCSWSEKIDGTKYSGETKSSKCVLCNCPKSDFYNCIYEDGKGIYSDKHHEEEEKCNLCGGEGRIETGEEYCHRKSKPIPGRDIELERMIFGKELFPDHSCRDDDFDCTYRDTIPCPKCTYKDRNIYLCEFFTKGKVQKPKVIKLAKPVPPLTEQNKGYRSMLKSKVHDMPLIENKSKKDETIKDYINIYNLYVDTISNYYKIHDIIRKYESKIASDLEYMDRSANEYLRGMKASIDILENIITESFDIKEKEWKEIRKKIRTYSERDERNIKTNKMFMFISSMLKKKFDEFYDSLYVDIDTDKFVEIPGQKKPGIIVGTDGRISQVAIENEKDKGRYTPLGIFLNKDLKFKNK